MTVRRATDADLPVLAELWGAFEAEAPPPPYVEVDRERERVAARVVANRVSAAPDGWRATFSERPICDVCGEPCKRGAVVGLGPFVYVGDGISDRCVSLAADRRFARRTLATWLDEQRVSYEPFGDLHDVAAALAAGAGPPGAGAGRGG